MAALLARRLRREHLVAVVALWLTGLGTPLLFDAGLVLAHTLAAACVRCGGIHGSPRDGDGPVGDGRGSAGRSAAVARGALLRTEGLLAVLAASPPVWSSSCGRGGRCLVAAALAAVGRRAVSSLDRWIAVADRGCARQRAREHRHDGRCSVGGTAST